MDPRICIVGAGNLSSKRIYPYIGAAGGQLVGVCDLDREKAEANTRRFGGTAYDDMEKMLDKEKPNGVMICINMDFHAKLAPLALKRGIPTYVEKPPAPSAAAALEVARIAQEHHTLCMAAFKKRYAECYVRAAAWIGSFPAADRYSLSIDYTSGAFKNDTLRSSFLFDFAVHALDLNRYLFGEVARVFAFAKGPNAYAVSLEYACGAVGTLNLSDGRGYQIPTEEVEITIKGGNAMTIHNSSCWKITQAGKAAEWREPPTFTSAGDSGNDTGHLAEITAFFAAINGHNTVKTDIYEGYKTLCLHEGILRSVESGQPVELTYETL